MKLLIAVVCVALTLLSVVRADDGDDEHPEHALQYNAELMKAEVPKKPHFIKFYAPWCGHCKKLAPTWEELAEKYNTKGGKEEFVIAKVDCTAETALCSEQGVTGYPTLQYYADDPSNPVKHRGGRTLATLEQFLREQKDGPAEEPEEEKKADEDAAVPEAKEGLVELTAGSFDKYTAHGDSFIKFYAPWCGHCKRLAPTWQELAKAYEGDEGVNIAKVDCTAHGTVCQAHEVRGYPTLLYFKNGKKVEKYGGGRDLDSLKSYVDKSRVKKDADAEKTDEKIPEKTEEKKEEKKEAAPEPGSDVVVLEASNFEDTIKKGTTIVKFYAPWCGHCKRLAPTWEELATKYKSNADITVAKMDCTTNRETCGTHKVNGFPTILLFRDGSRVAEHSGGRDLNALSSFIMDHTPHDEL